MKKIIIVNVVIFLALLFVIETFVFSTRVFMGKQNLGYVFTNISPYLQDDCKRMRTHLIFGFAHDHKGKCKIKGGYADGSFVVYDRNHNKPDPKTILTLGGSTTDGFFYQYSEGNTWPYLLNSLCNNCQVINGANGAYGSTNELLKLLVEGSVLNKKIDLVISFNGLNDIPNYNYFSDRLMVNYPFYNETNLSMMDLNLYINQKRQSYSKYLPNIFYLVEKISFFFTSEYKKDEKKQLLTKLSSNDLIATLGSNKSKVSSNTERWFNNVKMMHAISKEMGSEYMVFLQPALGLSGVQSLAPKGSNDEKIMLSLSRDKKEYLTKLRKTYSKLKSYCSELYYCYDISDTAPPGPNGDMYWNYRHHNAKGNKVIAEKILGLVNSIAP